MKRTDTDTLFLNPESGSSAVRGLNGLRGDEAACREYFFQCKFPDGFSCRSCGAGSYWVTAREYLHCSSCGAQTSLRSGTLFTESKKPLSLLFEGLFLFVSLRGGITARDLQEQLGFSSYQTAWTWLSRYREGAGLASAWILSGLVEIAQISYPQPGGREPAAIAVAVERGARNRIGSARLARLSTFSSAAMNAFLRGCVAPGSRIVCDGWNLLSDPAYRYTISEKRDPETPLASVRLVVDQLQRRISRSHPGPVSVRHLQRYLDEFQFRFNFRKERDSRALFDALLSAMVKGKPLTYRELTREGEP